MESTPARDAVIQQRFMQPGDKTEQDVWRRVADHWSNSPEEADEFFNMMNERRGFPNTPAIANAGKPLNMGSACFVLPIGDSLEDIMQTAKDAAVVQKSGGGTGFSFGALRAKGSPVESTGREAPGPVSFLKMYSQIFAHVTQAGLRPGANMGILPVDHPDIMEFITCKGDNYEITNFNISVGITDEFMEKVIAGDPSALIIWEAICQGAWKNGEPGVVFLDTMNNTRLHDEEFEATNPCVTGDTVISTLDGPRTFADLAEAGEDVLVHAWHPTSKLPVIRWMRRPHRTQQSVRILEVEFDSGLRVRCTPDHGFYSFRGKRVDVQDLKIGQSVRAWSMSAHRDGHLRVHGWDSERDMPAHQWLHRMVWENAHGEIPDGHVVHHKDEDKTNNALSNLEMLTEYDHQSHHYPAREAAGFTGSCRNHKVVAIRDAGTADVYNGCVDDAHTYIILDHEPVAGIASGIVSANCGEVPLLPYEACVLGSVNLAAHVRFECEHELPCGCKDFSKKVLDWGAFQRSVRTMTRMLDNIVDKQSYPLPIIEETHKRYRKIGVGVMGFADMLIKLGIIYGSQESIDLAEKISQRLHLFTRRESNVLTGEKNPGRPLWMRRYPSGALDPRNNLCTTVIAPTGTISRLAGCSFGIEPIFMANYKSYILGGAYEECHPLQDHEHFVTLKDVPPTAHVDIQAAFQKHVDQAVSKTVNLPNSATVEQVKELYMRAWQSGCKGTTVLRADSREDVVIEDCASGVCAL